jgi:hypothetical protein
MSSGELGVSSTESSGSEKESYLKSVSCFGILVLQL